MYLIKMRILLLLIVVSADVSAIKDESLAEMPAFVDGKYTIFILLNA